MALLKCHACDDDGNGHDGRYDCFVLIPTTTHATTLPIHTFDSLMLFNVTTCIYFHMNSCLFSYHDHPAVLV